jgi:integrase/recombinase XerD
MDLALVEDQKPPHSQSGPTEAQIDASPASDNGRVIFSASCFSKYQVVIRSGEDARALNAFLEATAIKGLSNQTLRTYAYALLSIWRWMQKASHSIDDLTEAHLAEYIRHLHEHAGSRGPPAACSINLRLIVARAYYSFHTNNELPGGARSLLPSKSLFPQPSRVGTHAVRRTRRRVLRVKAPRRLVVPLNRDEVTLLFASFRTSRDLSIAALMLFCGLRSREVLSLRLQEMHLLQEEIRVSGKGQRDRVLPIAPYVRRALSSYLQLERPFTRHDLLFVTLKGPYRGYPMTVVGLRELFRYHRKRCGVDNANPHRLRHTFAVDMVREGMALPVLMRLMGHANIEMTMRYVNLSAEDVRLEFERATRRIAGHRRGTDGNTLPNP